VTLNANGDARIETAGQDSGQGTYTALAQIAARELGIEPGRVRVIMGDSTLPAAPASSNSLGTASIGSAVKLATDKIRARLGGSMPRQDERAAAFRRLAVKEVSELGEFVPPTKNPTVLDGLRKGQVPFASQARGDETKDGKPLMFAFGAQFAEVRIHRLTHEIRVPRLTGAFAAGRIVNTRTAHSQYMGGMIWGMASGLLEATGVDEKRGRYVKDSFGEYLVPVNADIPKVDVILVPEEDLEVNPLGVKGIGEIGIVGGAAAMANAVYHATGKRVRDLPIVMDKLIV
jgi:xanthine dehydrogenase YagR molybdenum-binding subunit